MSAVFKRKDLLGIRELSAAEITHILDTAESFRDISRREIKKVPALRGRTVINLFFEPSTRTRTSFEIAAKRLSADAINISASTSSVTKGETLLDQARAQRAHQRLESRDYRRHTSLARGPLEHSSTDETRRDHSHRGSGHARA